MRLKLLIVYYLLGIRFYRWWYGDNPERIRQRHFRHFRHTLQQSPFYRSYATPDWKPADFPLMNKSRFMVEFNQINTRSLDRDTVLKVAIEAENSRDFSPTIKGITLGLSSGTTGNRGIFLADIHERARWVAAILDRVIGLSLRRRRVAFFLRANSNLYQATQSRLLDFQFFDITQPVDIHSARLEALQPHILIAQPSMLRLLAQQKQAGMLHLEPERVISVAEVLSEEDRTFFAQVFGQTIHQVYQCTEGFLAYTCRLGVLHFNDDFLLIEKRYLDAEKRRFHPIITDLVRRTQPVVRYELNDILVEQPHCACGSKHTAIAAIEGRADDVLCFRDEAGQEVLIFPDVFRKTIMLADAGIDDYMLLQVAITELQLFVASESPTVSFQLAEDSLTTLLYERGITSVRIQQLAHSPYLPGTKKRRVQNAIR